MLRFLPGPTVGTRRNLQQRRSVFMLWSAAWNWQTLALPRIPGGLLLRNPGRLIFSLPLLFPDAVPPWTCVWRPPLQEQLAVVLHRRHLIVNFRITGMKSENGGNRVFTTARLCGRTCGRTQQSVERFSVRQTSRPAETGSICRGNPSIAGGNTKSKSLSRAGGQPWHAQFSRILQRGQGGSSQASTTEVCTIGDMSPLSTATTTSTTLRLTQPYLTTTMPFSLASYTYESV